MAEKLFDEDEFNKWFRQAANTLESAGHDLKIKDYNWACFKAQQAAECSLKALLRGLGRVVVGHSALKFIEELERLKIHVSQSLKESGSSLDKHYIPARYPNAFPSGSPFEFYNLTIAKDAISRDAQHILNFIKTKRKKYA